LPISYSNTGDDGKVSVSLKERLSPTNRKNRLEIRVSVVHFRRRMNTAVQNNAILLDHEKTMSKKKAAS